MQTVSNQTCEQMLQSKKDARCTRPATKTHNGKHLCTQHFKLAGGVDSKPAAAAPQPAAKAAPKAAKPAPAPEPAKEEPVEVQSGDAIAKPAEKRNGDCEGKKATGAACGHPAKFTCSANCNHCGGAAYCGVHWNKAHKNATVSGGKTAKSKAPIPDDKKCSHTKKAGGNCGKPAYGCDADGALACWTHGGPKKSSTASTSEGASTQQASSGPFIGVSWPSFMSKMVDYFLDHSDGCKTCTEKVICPTYHAVSWLKELIDMHKEGTPATDVLLTHFANSDWIASEKKEFSVVHGHSMLYLIREVFGEANTNWIVRMFMNLSKQPGQEAAEVSAVWTRVAKDCGIELEVQTTPTGSSTGGKAAPILSARKTQFAAMLQKSKEKKQQKEEEEEQEAKPDVDDKGKEEAEPDNIIEDDEELEPEPEMTPDEVDKAVDELLAKEESDEELEDEM